MDEIGSLSLRGEETRKKGEEGKKVTEHNDWKKGSKHTHFSAIRRQRGNNNARTCCLLELGRHGNGLRLSLKLRAHIRNENRTEPNLRSHTLRGTDVFNGSSWILILKLIFWAQYTFKMTKTSCIFHLFHFYRMSCYWAKYSSKFGSNQFRKKLGRALP